jgi:hypothetical protein
MATIYSLEAKGEKQRVLAISYKNIGIKNGTVYVADEPLLNPSAALSPEDRRYVEASCWGRYKPRRITTIYGESSFMKFLLCRHPLELYLFGLK